GLETGASARSSRCLPESGCLGRGQRPALQEGRSGPTAAGSTMPRPRQNSAEQVSKVQVLTASDQASLVHQAAAQPGQQVARGGMQQQQSRPAAPCFHAHTMVGTVGTSPGQMGPFFVARQ
ncbi:unnamed protein product, partial [Polarella glacialis]